MNKEPPKIIAEISCNHEGKEDQLYSIIQSAKYAGADLVKIQAYTHFDMCNDDSYNIGSRDGTPWDGQNLVDLYMKGSTPDWMVEKAFRRAKMVGIPIFSSVFSLAGLEFLEKLGCTMYKIASFENNHYELIYKVAQLKKPMIVSTGFMYGMYDIDAIIHAASDNKDNLTLMHCISAYPTYNNEANIHRIPILRDITGCEIGFSDHTRGSEAAMAATVLGATYIEKHLQARDSASTSLDKEFSLDPFDFGKYTDNIKTIHKTLYATHDPQGPYKQFRRSIYAVKPIKAGEKITREHIGYFRPYQGIDPLDADKVIDATALYNIGQGHPILKANIKGLI